MENLQILVIVLEFILQSTSAPSPQTKILCRQFTRAPLFPRGRDSLGVFLPKRDCLSGFSGLLLAKRVAHYVCLLLFFSFSSFFVFILCLV